MASKTIPLKSPSRPDVEEVDALLPQTQCGRCGYAGCLPYAEAIVHGAVPINQCPPGGRRTIRALAALLGRPVLPLNPEYGEEQEYEAVAWIDEAHCIGCALCYKACPVDTIVGAPKLMHTVIEAECTGCELCIPPCPVDCIYMHRANESATATASETSIEVRARQKADVARRRYHFRQTRLEREKREQAERRQRKKANPLAAATNADTAMDKKKEVIRAARERVRRKRAGGHQA